MEIVLIQACADKYSHTPLVPQYYRFEGDFSKQDLASLVQHAKSMFAAKRYSAMKLLHLDVDWETNQVHILENLDVKNEIKKKTIINPEALAAKEARKAKKLTAAPSFFSSPPPINIQDILDEMADMPASASPSV